MSAIARLIGPMLKQGRITLISPDGSRETFGQGGKALTIRLTDRKVLFALMKNPRLGLGEAYMDGRLLIEDGNILDLLELITLNNRWEAGGSGRKLLGRGKKRFKALFRRNPAKRARTNVAHHYDIGNDLYRLFLDDDLQYSCAYFTDPANSLEQAQLNKKAHIAAKLALEPGQRVLDIGCGWGGTALYLHAKAGVDVLGVTLSEEQLQVASAARQGCRRRRPCEVRADRLSLSSKAASTGSFRSACSSMSAQPIMTSFSPNAAICWPTTA